MDTVILYIQATLEGNQDPKGRLLPYLERLLGDQQAYFITYYAARETQMPSVLPQHPAGGSVGQSPLQMKQQLSEGLDLEARRAREIIHHGLAVSSGRVRDAAASKGVDT